MKTAVNALIRKDFTNITANKRLFATILIVPVVLTVVVPALFLCMIHLAPTDSSDIQELLALVPEGMLPQGDLTGVLSNIVLNYMMPAFFLLIPIMASSIMAASSFVGEKEKHTLETLLYCPLTLREIFRAKVLASFLLSMVVTLCAFIAMMGVSEGVSLGFAGGWLVPDIKWAAILLVVAPAVSLIAITLIVRGSAKAQTVEEAQQGAVFLVLPVMALLVGQFTGLLLVGTWLLLAIGVVCAGVGYVLLHQAMARFTGERLLR